MTNLLSRNDKVGIIRNKYSRIPPSTSMHWDQQTLHPKFSSWRTAKIWKKICEDWLLCNGDL